MEILSPASTPPCSLSKPTPPLLSSAGRSTPPPPPLDPHLRRRSPAPLPDRRSPVPPEPTPHGAVAADAAGAHGVPVAVLERVGLGDLQGAGRRRRRREAELQLRRRPPVRDAHAGDARARRRLRHQHQAPQARKDRSDQIPVRLSANVSRVPTLTAAAATALRGATAMRHRAHWEARSRAAVVPYEM